MRGHVWKLAALIVLMVLTLPGCVAGLVVALDRPGCSVEQSVEEAREDGTPSTLKAEVKRTCPPVRLQQDRKEKR
jgi:hypothetical protein